MRSVTIAELRNHVSSYLREVVEGDEILIRSRSWPIAKLVPLSALDEAAAEEMVLAAAGYLRLPEAPLPNSIWDMPAPSVPLGQVVAAVEADREAD